VRIPRKQRLANQSPRQGLIATKALFISDPKTGNSIRAVSVVRAELSLNQRVSGPELNNGFNHGLLGEKL
jgi:hypothetical protein